ncbi:uncharacterized protein LOC105688921 isoform X2 [Athalia rosae]|uniref:uncharacterized protein LOC105688921 isoform X2 n=1 Tax=Athalia rosae TaxID=37344 RepID=UPI002033AB60|nr:uncharacterized protein LOC105688921 isoform X2 [Athalia rosae]
MPHTTAAGDSKKRLSILKTPKSRQAFQELDFDSSHENSADCGKKRRVSFAEKKHVKEFCDHKEQGTIWDNTYEESDQNVSHAIGTANEITNDAHQNIQFRENIDIFVGETEYTITADNNHGTNTENYIHPNRPISTTQIFNNSDADLEFTDMVCVGPTRIYDSLQLRQNIKSVSHNPSTKTTEETALFDNSDGMMDFTDVANKLVEPNLENETIIFEDSILDITPPVQSHLDLAKNLDQNKENIYSELPSNMLQHKVIIPDSNDNKNYSGVVDPGNKTILFNDFGCEMTEAIGTVRCRQSVDSQNLQIPVNRAGPNHKRNPDSNDNKNYSGVVDPGNKTILFNDFGCEMTEAIGTVRCRQSVDSQNLQIPVNRAGPNHKRNPDSNDNKNYNRVVDPGNKTILFNDFGCEMTEAIGTVRCRQSVDSQNLQIPVNRAGPNHKRNQSTLGDKTIFFDDFGCEMTEAVSSLKSNMGHNLNSVESPVPEQNIPLCLPDKNPATASLLDVEPMDVESITPPCEPNKETLPEFTANFKNNNQTKIFHDSDMEFTAMVTKNMINYAVFRENQMATKNQTICFDDCDVEITGSVRIHPHGAKSQSNTEEQDLLQNTASTSPEFHCIQPQRNVEKLPSKNLERIDTTEHSHTSITKNPEQDVHIAKTIMAATRPPSPISNIEGSDVCTNTEPTSIEFVDIGFRNGKKRKQDQMKDGSTSTTHRSLLLNENSENVPIQNVIPDNSISSYKSSELSRYCKHLKTTDPDESDTQFEKVCMIDNSVSLKDRRRTYVLSSNASIATQSKLPVEVTVTNDRVAHLDDSETVQECNKIIPLNPAPQLSAGEEISAIKQRHEEKMETSGEYMNDEPYYSFLGNVSDSDSDFGEVILISEQQQTFQNKNNVSLKSRLELEKSVDSSDDSCFTMFSKELEEQAKSCNCIWKIRSISKEKVLIDFISRSLVVIIHLETVEALTIPQGIKDIKIVSLLLATAEENIRMVHRIILNKLDPKTLKQLYRTTSDILPLLEFITQRVKLQIDFMHEFDRLQDLHHFIITGNQISFRLHSYKVQFAIKIIMDLEPFEDIGPNDINVQCILGSIREKDIKQLITSVKKDHNFLTNYINDVKEYITVVVERNFCF